MYMHKYTLKKGDKKTIINTLKITKEGRQQDERKITRDSA